MELPKSVLRQAKKDARAMKWKSRIDWIMDQDKEYRLICTLICTVAFLLVAGIGFLTFSWGMHWASAIGTTLLVAAVVAAIAFAMCTFVISETT